LVYVCCLNTRHRKIWQRFRIGRETSSYEIPVVAKDNTGFKVALFFDARSCLVVLLWILHKECVLREKCAAWTGEKSNRLQIGQTICAWAEEKTLIDLNGVSVYQ
jgi:hypothetical protein